MTAWPGLLLGDHDTRSPAQEPTTTALLDAQDHARDAVYNSGLHTIASQHLHTGNDSHLIVMPDVPNLVTDCVPQQTAAHDDLNNWTRSGLVGVDTYGLNFKASGGRATHPLGDAGNKLQFAGCDMVIAILVRSREPMTALTVRFGITDGDTSTFATGTRAEAVLANVSAGGFRRLFTLIRDFDSTAFASGVRVGIVTTGSFAPYDGVVDVTSVVVKPCSVLPQFEPGYYTPRQHDWELIGTGEPPLWDDVINFSRALYLAPA